MAISLIINSLSIELNNIDDYYGTSFSLVIKLKGQEITYIIYSDKAEVVIKNDKGQQISDKWYISSRENIKKLENIFKH